MADRAFEDNFRIWKSLINSEEESTTPIIERAEKQLLRHKPQSIKQAMTILEIIGESMAYGPRTDGLDVKAINNVKRWLAAIKGEAGFDIPVENRLRA